MRKLLNTIYVTNEQAYLTLDGENLVCKIDGTEKLRIPFENIENVVCFNYVGCSPALMGKCVGKSIPINFISPQGKSVDIYYLEEEKYCLMNSYMLEEDKEDEDYNAQTEISLRAFPHIKMTLAENFEGVDL